MKTSTNIMLWIVLLNATVGAAAAAGVWEDMGVSVETGVDDKIQKIADNIRQIRTGGFSVSTLIAIYFFAANTLLGMWDLVFAAPDVIAAVVGAGPFATAVGDLFSVAALILVVRDVLSTLTGGVR